MYMDEISSNFYRKEAMNKKYWTLVFLLAYYLIMIFTFIDLGKFIGEYSGSVVSVAECRFKVQILTEPVADILLVEVHSQAWGPMWRYKNDDINF